MLPPPARALAVLLAASVAPACTQSNPLFLPTSGDDTTSAASALDSTTDAPGSSTPDPDTGLDGSSTRPTTTGVEPETTTGLDPIDTGTNTGTSTGEPPPDTSTGQAETGDPPPEPVIEIVSASLATCVLLQLNLFLGYVGPLACELLTEQSDKVDEIGVMILDKAVDAGGGRESRVYLRFEIPPAPVDKVLIDATLSLHVSASLDAGAAWSGELYLSDPFDANGLKVFAPGGILLTGDPGPAIPDQPSSWQIPVQAIAPNQPLYLGVGALSDDSVAFRSTRASPDKHPTVTLVYQ